MTLGPINVTQLGALAGAGGIILESMRIIRQNGFWSDLLKGISSEGVNAPRIEGVQRVGAGASMPGAGGMFGGAQPQGTGYSSNFAVSAGPIAQVGGPYATPLWWWT